MNISDRNSRPINVNPLTISLPITALVSIAHRITGVALFLLLPFMLWLLDNSLRSSQGLEDVKQLLGSVGAKVVIWILVVSIIFHITAGIRHLLMDCHIGESKRGGKIGAYIVALLSLGFIVYFSICIWG